MVGKEAFLLFVKLVKKNIKKIVSNEIWKNSQ